VRKGVERKMRKEVREMGRTFEEKWEGGFDGKWEVGGKKDEKGCGGKMTKGVQGERQVGRL
jgi:hypothetical protein